MSYYTHFFGEKCLNSKIKSLIFQNQKSYIPKSKVLYFVDVKSYILWFSKSLKFKTFVNLRLLEAQGTEERIPTIK